MTVTTLNCLEANFSEAKADWWQLWLHEDCWTNSTRRSAMIGARLRYQIAKLDLIAAQRRLNQKN